MLPINKHICLTLPYNCIASCFYALLFITELLKVVDSPPVTTTTTSVSLPGDGSSSSFKLDQPTEIQQTPQHSSVPAMSQARLGSFFC